MVINNEKWAALGDDDKAAFARAADKSCDELGKMMDDHYAQILKTAQEKGVTLRELTPAEVAAWGEASDYRAELDRWAQEQQQNGTVGATAVLAKLKARLLPPQ